MAGGDGKISIGRQTAREPEIESALVTTSEWGKTGARVQAV